MVQQASVDLLARELADTTRRYEAGTVPRFNVLRAEVELANAVRSSAGPKTTCAFLSTRSSTSWP